MSMLLDQQAAGYFDSVYGNVTGHEDLETDVLAGWADEPRRQAAKQKEAEELRDIRYIAPTILQQIGETVVQTIPAEALVPNSDQQPLIIAA